MQAVSGSECHVGCTTRLASMANPRKLHIFWTNTEIQTSEVESKGQQVELTLPLTFNSHNGIRLEGRWPHVRSIWYGFAGTLTLTSIQLQPLSRCCSPSGAKIAQGGQAVRSRASGRYGPEIREVGGEFHRAIVEMNRF